ncbi:MAG: hypothetical protein HXX17_13750 [Geobacteraceae bacterium]|nr:hypothetical protein [Geobacteraceae bacterium]
MPDSTNIRITVVTICAISGAFNQGVDMREEEYDGVIGAPPLRDISSLRQMAVK